MRWKSAKFKESREELFNPGIGWYQIHSFFVSEDFHADEEQWALNKEQHLVLLRLHLGVGKNCALTERELLHIDEILRFFVEKKKDIILRFVYDTEGKGIENEPSLFSQVLEHIGQLGDVLEKYTSDIYLYQGILVGSWGEMHNSKFLAPEKVRVLAERLQQIFSETTNTFLALRRPADVRLLCKENEWEKKRLTCFDDAIFGSATHMGTFGMEDTSEWSSMWIRERELDFMEKLGECAPVGGEAVMPESSAQNPILPIYLSFDSDKERDRSFRKMVEELRKLQVSYLNCRHDTRLLEVWRQCVWSERGIWKGMSGYDYIGRHLGYRFVVRSCKVHREKSGWALTVDIENVGFSNAYEELEVFLVGGSEGDAVWILPWNPMAWKSGAVIRERFVFEEEEKFNEIFSVCGALGLRRKRDGMAVRFANERDERGFVCLGSGVV